LVIEHTFVTTLEASQALAAASDFLARGGFQAEAEHAFQVGAEGWTTLEMKRGRRSAARAKDPTQCPQQVRLEWDRGRVTVGASIEAAANRNRAFLYGGVVGLAITAGRKSSKQAKDYTDLMIVIARGLDNLLARQMPGEQAGQEWFALEASLKERARRQRIRSWIYLGIFLALIIGCIVLIAVTATSRR
jgi:hypothetical protein